MTVMKEGPSGSRPLVICLGVIHEAANLTEAIDLAEDLSHRHHAEAFVLKPIKKISPTHHVEMKDLA